MQKEGFVSLWVGNIKTSEELDNLLRISYTEDGDLIQSIFASKFHIERYDDAFREAELYDDTDNSLSRLLEGFSYDDVIVPKFASLLGEQLNKRYNAAILLYNFQYNGDVKEATVGSSHVEFLATTEYQ
ncbi:immunity 22 family protein [Tumebacillus permanentifrigoris]|uniref:Immunity protein 22 of polymorphic toxin system n=1 Tax=Tumebacillus permanentifrigoris TaxID=378543 RepID=A0A316D9V7_9BACL|nr:immunity 22 family protein [Tumebacillus permanentifrigoris]PWK14251.1 immunity protein 22 of polymorphic toxin system [Tumebacillus permanentifrigoris]